ncbi:23S rRNA pseudouridine(1911/1915/1917) synthase RluD [Nitrosospira sp. Is2]|uniref:23S rRNA pseudouridine(1911/1915/1917) synthase RluD n=1 Tax=Nitrosospira sp. Is2 TaxID=3080532 RepID=UPI002954B858|nr:23S rRNA pseudouridine(1911/1915/1917) synthase RluD [Nitrosospira sp. Is2]WON74501.1 23S rRNA pseudouridine(1911/1915/1917) synthase RluD [Nitrosospira sp. Is2]
MVSEPVETIVEVTIPADCAGARLDQALARLLPDWSRSRLQTWIREKRISVDGAEASPKQKVWSGEKVEVRPAVDPVDAIDAIHAPESISLDILYEDDSLIVVNKPAGLVVHPGSGNWQGTMLNALLHHAADLNGIPRAGIVHRLDKDTSGLLVVAKTLEAQTHLVRQLQKHTVNRDYLALVLGAISVDGCVDAPVGRHPVERTKMAVTANGKPARTFYRVLEKLDGCTLLRCRLETGRTHQIRVHMHSIGHPLLGDPVYKGKPDGSIQNVIRLAGFSRQALHAQRLELTHPQHGTRMAWEAPLPDDMKNLLLMLGHQSNKSVFAVTSVSV